MKSFFTSWETAVSWLRDQPDARKLVEDSYYDDPHLDACERYRASDEWLEIRTLLEGYSGKALDIGAGRGIASFALAKEGFSVFALEPDKSELVGAKAIRKLAGKESLDISVVEEYGEKLPFRSSTFDVIFARAVLHHANSLDSVCSEIYRVLKPNGIFIGVREHVIDRKKDLNAFLGSHPLHNIYGGENAFLLKDYLKSIRRTGFKDIKILRPLESPINYHPYSKAEFRELVLSKLGFFSPIKSFFSIDIIFKFSIFMLRYVDRRPGRLYSFIVKK